MFEHSVLSAFCESMHAWKEANLGRLMSKGVGEGFHEYWIGAFYAVAFTPGDLDRRKDYLLHFVSPSEWYLLWSGVFFGKCIYFQMIRNRTWIFPGMFHEFEVGNAACHLKSNWYV